jgi:hypothetical protein
MAEILRVRARWSGFIGGPGYTVLHFKEFEAGGTQTLAAAQGAVDKTRAFFNSIKGALPANTTVQVMPDVDVIEETTGQLTNALTTTTPVSVVGGAVGTATYSAATGAVITWRTSVIRNGRRIRGRSFLVPLSSVAFDVDGTLHSTYFNTISTAATALRDGTTSGDLGVYARPSAPGAADGIWAVVTGHTVPDMGAVLRSRRD